MAVTMTVTASPALAPMITAVWSLGMLTFSCCRAKRKWLVRGANAGCTRDGKTNSYVQMSFKACSGNKSVDGAICGVGQRAGERKQRRRRKNQKRRQTPNGRSTHDVQRAKDYKTDYEKNRIQNFKILPFIEKKSRGILLPTIHCRRDHKVILTSSSFSISLETALKGKRFVDCREQTRREIMEKKQEEKMAFGCSKDLRAASVSRRPLCAEGGLTFCLRNGCCGHLEHGEATRSKYHLEGYHKYCL